VEIISQFLLLEVLLGQVLNVSLGEWRLSSDSDVLVVLGDGDSGSEIAFLAIDFYSLFQKVLEVFHDEDIIFDRLSAVDLELQSVLLGLGNGLLEGDLWHWR